MIHVFFNIDDKYERHCKTVIRSIKAHTNENICFHIIGLDNFDFKDNVKCYGVPDVSILKYKNRLGYISSAASYRLFAPSILEDLDKVIYLDCDLIVLDDIKKLWDYNVKCIAGVQDPLYNYHAKRNGLKHLYINSGVMVMNLKYLRKINYLERIAETQNGLYDVSLLDQDIINIAFGNLIEHLPLKWNVYSKIYAETTYDMIEARKNPSIIHWCGNKKPWNADVWYAEEWRKYDS